MSKRIKRLLQKLSETYPEDMADVHEALREAHFGKSDRACVLIMGAAIEFHLADLLRAKLNLYEDEQEYISLFVGDQAILGTFSSRITMSYAMGLISDKERIDLRIIKDVRNAFAHSARAISFETEGIADSCGQLQTFDIAPENADLLHIPRVRFIVAAHSLACLILQRTAIHLQEKTRRLRDALDHLEASHQK